MVMNTFIQYLTYEKRCSQHTLTAYTTDLNQFTNFLNQQFEIDTIVVARHRHIRSWIVHLMRQGISSRTIHRKLATLKSLYHYLQRREIISQNPMQKVIAPKARQTIPAFLKETETERLFDDVVFEKGFSGMRDKCLLEVLYETGMRRSELIKLQLQDVDLSQNYIKVTGKGNKQRLIPFGNTLLNSIQAYIEIRNQTFGGLNAYLFLTNKGAKLYPKFVYNVVHRYLSMVTTIDKRSPHIMRHSFATHLLNNGADLEAIKMLLGHQSLAATQIYTHNSLEKLKTAYEKAHPKAKKGNELKDH